jgi:hypothetical protein
MDGQKEEGEKEGKGEKLRQSIGPTSTIAIQVYRDMDYTMAMNEPLLDAIVRNGIGNVDNEEMVL